MSVRSPKFILCLVASLLMWGFIFFDSLVSMESVWRSSNTFTHGYFILPIVVWLVWRDKAYLLNSQLTTSFLPIPIIVGSLSVYLFSYAADINVLSQLSAVACLVSVLWLLIGNKAAWHYKFPLAFLFFLVPMGENLIPDLQDITAWFTVLYLKLIGIPVFRDGLYIQIPAGMFEVAVACSGIRFLISSFVVGTLYAYLSYNSLKKQVLFCAFAFVLPIIANGFRAFLIVLIAHLSDMEYATGADHLIYGWVFFGFVIMIMFWVGAKFSDPELTEEQLIQRAQSDFGNVKTYSYAAVTVSVVLLALSFLLKQQITVTELPSQPSAALNGYKPVERSNWGITFGSAIKHSHVYIDKQTQMLRAVYADKQTKGELISSRNKLFDFEQWTIVGSKHVQVNTEKAKIIHLRNIRGNVKSFIYQYRSGDTVLVSAPKTKLLQAWHSITGQFGFSEIRAVAVDDELDTAIVEKRLVALLGELNRAAL